MLFSNSSTHFYKQTNTVFPDPKHACCSANHLLTPFSQLTKSVGVGCWIERLQKSPNTLNTTEHRRLIQPPNTVRLGIRKWIISSRCARLKPVTAHRQIRLLYHCEVQTYLFPTERSQLRVEIVVSFVERFVPSSVLDCDVVFALAVSYQVYDLATEKRKPTLKLGTLVCIQTLTRIS
jgi:hypothetical protein